MKKRSTKNSKNLRSDSQNSFRQILLTADQVLDENPQASLLKIAEAAGLTRITVYRHFKSREKLLETLKTEAMKDAVEVLAATLENEDKFIPALEKFISEFLKNAARWRALSQFPQTSSKGALKYREQLRVKLDELMRKGQKEGYVDPSAEVMWIRNTFLGLISQSKKRQKELGYDIETLTQMIVKTFLYGAYGRAESRRS